MRYNGVVLTIATALNSIQLLWEGLPHRVPFFAAAALGCCFGVLVLTLTNKDRV